MNFLHDVGVVTRSSLGSITQESLTKVTKAFLFRTSHRSEGVC
jgi:hypothetical protein